VQEGVVTVMFSDVEGSTDVTRRLGDVEGRRVIEAYKKLVREELARHDGREIDSIGDGFFITFRSTRRAVGCAVAIQKALLEHGQEHPGEHVRARIGLNVGEVIERDGHPFGAAVNATERVASRANGGQILVSEPVRHLAGTIPGISFRSRGRFAVKGFSERWRLYEIDWERPERPPPRPVPKPETKPRWRLPALVAGGLALAAAAAVVLTILLTGGGTELSGIDANAVGILDPSSGKIVGQVHVGARPTALAFGEGGLWVANADDRTVWRIDPNTLKQVSVIGTGSSSPSDVAAGEGSVWVPTRSGNELVVISPRTNGVEDRIPFELGAPAAVAVGGGFVWIAEAQRGRVTRLAPETGGERVSERVGSQPSSVAFGEDGVWVANSHSMSVSRLSPRTGHVVARHIALDAQPSAIATGEGAVWAASIEGDSVYRIDPRSNESVQTIPVGNAPVALAAGEGAVWVANSLDRSVSRIDPKTNKVVQRIPVGSSPDGVVVARGRVWVAAHAP
jgi:YVTN family beta-propeller protein